MSAAKENINSSPEKLVKDINGVSYQQTQKGAFFRATYQNKAVNIERRSKDFFIEKHGLEDAFQKAVSMRKEWEKEFGENPLRENAIVNQKKDRVCENEYIIKDDYFILKVKHTKKMIIREFKIDKDKLEEVKKYYWGLDLHQKTAKTSINNKKVYLRHFLYPDKDGYINHINRDKCDFREEKVEFREHPDYVSARVYEETENAPPGVHFEVTRENYRYWAATFDKEHFNKKKRFNINKFGKEKAKQRAIEQREKWEEEYERGLLTQ